MEPLDVHTKRVHYVATLISIITWSCMASPQATINIQTKSAIHKTSDMYFSLGMDSNLVRNKFETFDFNSKRLMTLAQGLAPAYLRLMGTDGDRMTFTFNESKARHNGFFFPTTSFVITAKDWDLLNQFCIKAGWRLLFGFNAQLRYEILNGTAWDPSNAMEILDYSIKKGYNKNLDFELGNEPIAYGHRPGWVFVSNKQLAKDFNLLKKLLDDIFTGYYTNSIIVGPDFAVLNQQRVNDFLNNVGDFLAAMTFHQYYGGSEFNHTDNYTNPGILDGYINFVASIKQFVLHSNKPNIKIWNGETSSTVDPSGTGLEESFVAVFMLLDKYGVSAKMGLDVCVRQTFYGFWFALVNNKLEPTPNYWVSWYYKKLVGQNVLSLNATVSGVTNVPQKFRFYAHCTKESSLYPAHMGSVTVYGMNMFHEDVSINWSKSLLSSVAEIHQYVFTGWVLASKSIFLNGEKVSMISDTEMPQIHPKVVKPSDKIKMPAMSVAFYVLPNAKAAACM